MEQILFNSLLISNILFWIIRLQSFIPNVLEDSANCHYTDRQSIHQFVRIEEQTILFGFLFSVFSIEFTPRVESFDFSFGPQLIMMREKKYCRKKIMKGKFLN